MSEAVLQFVRQPAVETLPAFTRRGVAVLAFAAAVAVAELPPVRTGLTYVVPAAELLLLDDAGSYLLIDDAGSKLLL